jgi:hypothetical protein
MHEAPYAHQWRNYRRASWAAAIGLVVGLPLVTFLAIRIRAAFAIDATLSLLALLLVWAIVWAMLCVRVTRFTCPRCHGLFFAHSQIYLGAGKACSQCGLPLYAAGPSSEPLA